jgi:hypothetical protein
MTRTQHIVRVSSDQSPAGREWNAECSCGWFGRFYRRPPHAHEEAREHEAAMAAQEEEAMTSTEREADRPHEYESSRDADEGGRAPCAVCGYYRDAAVHA